MEEDAVWQDREIRFDLPIACVLFLFFANMCSTPRARWRLPVHPVTPNSPFRTSSAGFHGRRLASFMHCMHITVLCLDQCPNALTSGWRPRWLVSHFFKRSRRPCARGDLTCSALHLCFMTCITCLSAVCLTRGEERSRSTRSTAWRTRKATTVTGAR